MRRIVQTLLLSGTLLLSACGDGSGSGTTGGAGPFPTPTPTPTPSPSPSPTPTPSSGQFTANLAGAVNGSSLVLQRACTSAPTFYANGQISDVGVGTITLPAATNVQYFTGQERIVGLGDTFYRGPTGSVFTPFDSLSDFTLQVANKTDSSTPAATLGFSDRGGFCFFAAGLPPDATTTLSPGYEGRVDGLNQFADFEQRLFGSKATVTMNTATSTGRITIQPFGYNQAFGNFIQANRGPLLPLSADLTVSGTKVTASNIVGFPGYTGTMTGQLVGTRGMILAFEMRNGPDVVWGAIALDNTACLGCWDY